jgi:peroxiredoxin
MAAAPKGQRPPARQSGAATPAERRASLPAAPEFDLPDLSGKRVRLEALRGRFVLLTFWAFWCDTWKDVAPQLADLASRRSDLNFCIVAISVDGTRLPELLARRGAPPPFPVALDIGGKATEQYRVEHVPTVMLLDAAGRIRYTCVGWPGNQVILNHLREAASAAQGP